MASNIWCWSSATRPRDDGRGDRAPLRAPWRLRPELRPVGVKDTVGLRAIVASDPELTGCRDLLHRMALPDPRSRRSRPSAGTWSSSSPRAASDRRPTRSWRRVMRHVHRRRRSIDRWAGAARIITAQATAKLDRWRPALADLATSLQRARPHGLAPPRSRKRARRSWLQPRRRPSRGGLRPGAAAPVADERRGWRGASRGSPPTSGSPAAPAPARHLGRGGVVRTFAASFDPQNTLVVLTVPGAGAPTESELASPARSPCAVAPAAPEERARPDRLALACRARACPSRRRSTPGRPSGPGLGSTTVCASTTARSCTEERGATVWITLAGGQIQERPDDRGLTEAAVAAWKPPPPRLAAAPTSGRSWPTRRQRAATSARYGHALRVRRARRSRSGLELALPVLTDPVVESAGFAEQWKAARALEIAVRRARVFAGRSPRPRPPRSSCRRGAPSALTELQLERASRATRPRRGSAVDRARADRRSRWSAISTGRRAAALVARYVGSLSPRPRIDLLAAARAARGPTAHWPHPRDPRAPTRTDQAQVLDGSNT